MCRRTAEARSLHEFEKLYTRLSLHRLDITIPEDLYRISLEFANIPLDLLINNSSIFLDKDNTGVGSIDYERWLRTLEVNTLGTMRVIEAMVENVAAGTNGLNLITVLSDLTCNEQDDDGMPNCLYYRSSKAALNSAMQDIAVELKQRNVGLLMLSPGPVETPTGPATHIGLTTQKSVSGMRQIIADYSPIKNGCFYAYDGSRLNSCGYNSSRNQHDMY